MAKWYHKKIMMAKPTRRDANENTRTLFYWWFQYLLRSEAFCFVCERKGEEGDVAVRKVYAEVGDIRLASFDAWWEITGKALANGRPDILDISDLLAADGNIDIARLEQLRATGKYLIPIIPRWTSIKAIENKLAEVESFVGLKYTGRQFPLRVLMPKPPEKLKVWLRVWDIKKQHPDWTSDQIAAEADIATPGDKRDSQLRVNRYLRIAQQLIDNAAIGKFAEFEKY